MMELLAMIAIVSVLAKAALGHFDTRREDINTTMSMLMGEFRSARTQAITTGTHYALKMTDSQSLTLNRYQQADDGTWTVAATTRTIALPKSVSWWIYPDTLEFNTRGTMISADAPIYAYVTDNIGERAHSFSVWPSGQVHQEY
jgi:Tfp pilus assembly protein FimT